MKGKRTLVMTDRRVVISLFGQQETAFGEKVIKNLPPAS